MDSGMDFIQRYLIFFLFLFIFFILNVFPIHSGIFLNESATELEIGIDEKLGEYVPLDLQFKNEEGELKTLKELVDKPTILSLVYYNCPGICSPMLSGEVEVLDIMDMEPGKDYRALTISFNPAEGPELARNKKRNYFKAFRRRTFPEDAWIWMSGDSINIAKLTDAVGFRFKKVGTEFAHAGALIVLSPGGKVARYLRGIQFQPFDLKMAITEAAEGRVGPTISKLLLFCFSYDPQGREYVFNVTKVTATIFLATLGVFIFWLTVKSKVKVKKAR
jgi:protein SCO1/2